MESGADDVFLSSDVDLDVRLKVCAAKSTVFLGMRKTQKEHHSLTELFPPTSQLRRLLSSMAACRRCVCKLTPTLSARVSGLPNTDLALFEGLKAESYMLLVVPGGSKSMAGAVFSTLFTKMKGSNVTKTL